MRTLLFVACMAAAVQTLAADKPAESKAPWLVQATTNPVSYTGDHAFKVELKITNNTDGKQTLKVPRFWECHCDSNRLNFGGWDQELRPYLPIPAPKDQPIEADQKPSGGHPIAPPPSTGGRPPMGVSPANSFTDVELAPGASYTRSWNWVDSSKDSPPADFTFRMGLVINGSIGNEPVWSSPITLKAPKPSDKTGKN